MACRSVEFGLKTTQDSKNRNRNQQTKERSRCRISQAKASSEFVKRDSKRREVRKEHTETEKPEDKSKQERIHTNGSARSIGNQQYRVSIARERRLSRTRAGAETSAQGQSTVTKVLGGSFPPDPATSPADNQSAQVTREDKRRRQHTAHGHSGHAVNPAP